MYVLAHIATLHKLDFTTVIPSDREKALRWRQSQSKRKPRKSDA
jgi:hypothetical protein